MFFQTHLTASAKESHLPFFRELTNRLYNMSDQLGEIIHFRKKANDPIFCKTALNWALEKNHMLIVLELLKLEHHFHRPEEENLECLKNNVSYCYDKRQWILKKYDTISKLGKISKSGFLGTLLGEFYCVIFF
jgi:hypothetical protein